MKNVLLLAKNILRVTFRKKSSYFAYIIMPVLVVLLSFSLTALPSSPARIGVSNADRGALGADVLAALDDSKSFVLVPVSRDQINELIKDKSIDYALVIPQDFTASLGTSSPGSVDIVSTGEQQKSIALIQSIINVSVQNLRDLSAASGGDQAKFDKLYSAYRAASVGVDTVAAGDERKSKSVTNSVAGLFVMFLLFGTAIVSSLIINEKTTRTFYRIVCAPVSSRQYLLANLLTNFLIVMVQIGIVVLAVTEILHIELAMPVWQFVTVMLCFGLASIGIGFLIVSLSRDSSQASSLQTLIIIPTSLLAGCFWPTSIMPDFMQKLAYLTPQHWVLMAIDTLQQGKGFAGVLPDIAVIIAFALAFFLVAMYRFSRNQDMQTVS